MSYMLYPYSPAVLGCLWEVTDGEIDHLGITIIESIHQEIDFSLLMRQAREHCPKMKLKFLTGASTAIYGIPVTFKNS